MSNHFIPFKSILNDSHPFQFILYHYYHQCHSAEPEDVVEKLLEMTENTRSQVNTKYKRFSNMARWLSHKEPVSHCHIPVIQFSLLQAPSAISFPSSFSPTTFATVHGKMSSVPGSPASSLRGSVASNRDHYRKPIPFQVNWNCH